MTDPLADRLASARVDLETRAEVLPALESLAAARAADGRRSHTRRTLVSAISVGAALTVTGAGAVAATQWGPWTYVEEPDVVIARDWTDVDGVYLGSCEARLAADAVPADALAAARDYLDSIDLATIEPDPERVAGDLNAVGRLDEVGRLIPGAIPTDFDVTLVGEQWPSEYFTDARILHEGLVSAVFTTMSDAVLAQWPELAEDGLSAAVETQCTTDPVETP